MATLTSNMAKSAGIISGIMADPITAAKINMIGLPLKLQYSTQIGGAYNLLYPHILLDYPTRLEVQTALELEIKKYDKTHCDINWHNGGPIVPCSSGDKPPIMILPSKKGVISPIKVLPLLPKPGTINLDKKTQNQVKTPTTDKNEIAAKTAGYGV